MEVGDPGTVGVAAQSHVDQGTDLDQENAIILLHQIVDKVVKGQVLIQKNVTKCVVQVKQRGNILSKL